jgi:hypothetical protein
MEALFTALESEGYAAARVPDIDPFFVTDAPHETVMDIVRAMLGAASTLKRETSRP